MSKATKSSKGGNIVGIFFGCSAFFGMMTMIILMISQKQTGGMLPVAIIMGAISAFLLIFNGVRLHRKIVYDRYQGNKSNYSSSYDSSSSKPNPKPSRQNSSSYPPKNERLIRELEKGRNYIKLNVGGFHGEAELSLRISYSRGEYTIKPILDLDYNKYTVKTQADVDDLLERAINAYEKHFKEMVRICDSYDVGYEIKEPEIRTNISANGDIV